MTFADQHRSTAHAQSAAGQIRVVRWRSTSAIFLQPHMSRQSRFGRSQLSDDCSERRIISGRFRSTGQSHRVGLSVLSHVMRHRANDCDVLRHAGELRHQLADLKTRRRGLNRQVGPTDLPWRIGLQIPRVQLTQATILMDEDAGLWWSARCRRRILSGFRLQQVSEGQSDSPDATCLQHATPRQQRSRPMICAALVRCTLCWCQ